MAKIPAAALARLEQSALPAKPLEMEDQLRRVCAARPAVLPAGSRP